MSLCMSYPIYIFTFTMASPLPISVSTLLVYLDHYSTRRTTPLVDNATFKRLNNFNAPFLSLLHLTHARIIVLWFCNRQYRKFNKKLNNIFVWFLQLHAELKSLVKRAVFLADTTRQDLGRYLPGTTGIFLSLTLHCNNKFLSLFKIL